MLTANPPLPPRFEYSNRRQGRSTSVFRINGVGGSLLGSGQPVVFEGEFVGYFDDGLSGYPRRIPGGNPLWIPYPRSTLVLVKCVYLAGLKGKHRYSLGSALAVVNVKKAHAGALGIGFVLGILYYRGISR